jgi:geranylgeranyl reductase family protein
MTPTEHYDLVVVGGGPAGAAFVRTFMDRGGDARVLMLERAKFPRDKACGDALTHASVPLTLEIFPSLRGALPTQSHTRNYTLYYDERVRLRRHDQRWDVIPRRTYDALLWQSLDGGAEDVRLAEGCRVKRLLKHNGRVDGLVYTQDGRDHQVRSKVVVGADGSLSLVRRETGTLDNDRRVTAVRQYVRGIPKCEDGLVFMVDSANHGYFWFFPFERDGERWANMGCGSLLSSVNPRQQFERFLRKEVVQHYIGAGKHEGALKGAPLNLALTRFNRIRLARRLAGDGYVLLGDAAGLVHPHTGEGIAAALHSGRLAAELLANGACPKTISTEYERRMLEFAHGCYQLSKTALAFHLPFILPKSIRALLGRMHRS